METTDLQFRWGIFNLTEPGKGQHPLALRGGSGVYRPYFEEGTRWQSPHSQLVVSWRF